MLRLSNQIKKERALNRVDERKSTDAGFGSKGDDSLLDDALIKQINLEGNRGARERYRSIDVDKRGPTSILQETLVTEEKDLKNETDQWEERILSSSLLLMEGT